MSLLDESNIHMIKVAIPSLEKKIDIPPLCPCMVAAIASRSTSKSEPVPPTCLIELTELLCSDSPDPKNI